MKGILISIIAILITMVLLKPEVKTTGIDTTFEILSFGAAKEDIAITIKSCVSNSNIPSGDEFAENRGNSDQKLLNSLQWN